MATEPVWTNPSASSYDFKSSSDHADVLSFHEALPHYSTTPLVSLPAIAKDLGIAHLFIKDESHRFGLPSFKILGASWAIFRAIAAATNLPHASSSLQDAAKAAQAHGVKLCTCSDGNWGRAVARMAKYLGIPATVFVPRAIGQATQDLIAGEGATVRVVQGDYDAAISAARREAEVHGGLLVMDTSWSGYTQCSRWVVDGYSSMLKECDEQVREVTGLPVALAVVSVGVGSWAQSVVEHFKAKQSRAAVVTVEPETAACLRTSLKAGTIVPIETGDTIMCGMCCGTVSSIAWPVLKDGVDVSVVISDKESHEAVQQLHQNGVLAGPCGAAPLAALRNILDYGACELHKDSVVLLFCTEGARPYENPA